MLDHVIAWSGADRTARETHRVMTAAELRALAARPGHTIGAHSAHHLSLTLQPAEHFRVSTMISRREVAPGAEEFMPRLESGIWMPPQRTFSSLLYGQSLQAERTNHVEVEVERDLLTGCFQRLIQLARVAGHDDTPGAAHVDLRQHFQQPLAELGIVAVRVVREMPERGEVARVIPEQRQRSARLPRRVQDRLDEQLSQLIGDRVILLRLKRHQRTTRESVEA